MLKALIISKTLEDYIPTIVTFLMALLLGARMSDTLSIIASVIAITASSMAVLFWWSRLKERVFDKNQGNLWEYIKDLFKKFRKK